MKPARRKRPVRAASVLFGALLALGAAAVAAGFVLARNRAVAERLEEAVARLESAVVPLRFMVLSRSEKTVSARFRFYDADGEEISSFERSWNGTELFVDSIVVPVKGGALVFPARVFTEETAPGRGTELFHYYDRQGFPAVFGSARLSEADRAAFSSLFAAVRGADGRGRDATSGEEKALRGAYGNAVHDVARLRAFEVGVVYALVARTDGGVEIVRD